MKEAATLPHLFTFENFFELPLDPLDRDVGHGCVCSDAAPPRTPGASLCLPGASVGCCKEVSRNLEGLLSLSPVSTCLQKAAYCHRRQAASHSSVLLPSRINTQRPFTWSTSWNFHSRRPTRDTTPGVALISLR